jgi:hypothetical protein
MKKTLCVLVVAMAAAAFAGSCSSASPSPSPSPAAFTVQAVVFSFADVSSLTTAGATAQVTALGVSANGITRDITATCTNWQSDDPSVLSVSSGGLLTAQRSSGSATIATTCQGVSALGLVTVNSPLSNPPFTPAPTTCTNPPYTWDANPNVLRCRESNGRFAASACCGH